ncbi:MAG TPA: extensin family protein, partial [Hyphomicrobiaceae bacterium]|nr:extensin family protein [Hyphomicrobiaceae bacterium]
PPSRLGGPKSKTATASAALSADRKAQFLRRIHTGACKTFFTILGPEANEAHRNHFHVDMAERRSGHFCE